MRYAFINITNIKGIILIPYRLKNIEHYTLNSSNIALLIIKDIYFSPHKNEYIVVLVNPNRVNEYSDHISTMDDAWVYRNMEKYIEWYPIYIDTTIDATLINLEKKIAKYAANKNWLEYVKILINTYFESMRLRVNDSSDFKFPKFDQIDYNEFVKFFEDLDEEIKTIKQSRM